MGKGFTDGYKTYDTSNGFGNKKQWSNSFKERMEGKEAKRIISESKESPYYILGISEDATDEQIKKAYRSLIIRWHPDKNPGDEYAATEKTKKIIAAYTVLINGKGKKR